MIAVATRERDMDRLTTELDSLGLAIQTVAAPSDERRVALVAVPKESSGERLAVELRSRGMLAVSRPDGGARLAAWQRDTAPVTIADRITVSAAWSEHHRHHAPGLIELGHGGFGSGHHPTTRLIIEELVERVRLGGRVLDVGCGSGVLALSALALGASHAVAVDLKPEAVLAAERNADLNDLAGLDATLEPLDAIPGPFDVVVANIARAGIVELARVLVAQVAAGGCLAVSGISPRQCDQIAGFLRPLTEVRRRSEGEWAVMVLQK